MSDTNNRPNADGSLRGDDKPMPDRGTSTNMSDTYGADLSQSAKNQMGKITSATKSDAMDDCYADDPTIGGRKDADDY